jgi:putative transposase
MEIHPKSLYKIPKENCMGHYVKEEDVDLLPQIKSVIEKRPTYGYKRVTAMLNKQRAELKLPRINKKRVYRIMKINGLILPKSQRLRAHEATGKVMTLHSNTRWCSDGMEIRCFNGEKVYVAFVLDCCDREAISYVARTRHLVGEDIQSLMIESVEKRFGKLKTDRELEFLSDRGGIYRAYNVQKLAHELGLKSCFTAAYSPESNGMAESFVKTIKRDYVYVNDCESAEAVLKMLPNWFEDYNQVAPHSALGMRSPVEYRLAINNG